MRRHTKNVNASQREPTQPFKLGDDLDPGAGVRRLRLSSILIDLAEEAKPADSHRAAATVRADASASTPAETASQRPVRAPKVRSNLTLGDIVDRTTHA